MAQVILDWDSKYKKAVITSNYLDVIRATFSVPNESKDILKRTGRPSWYVPDFVSPISNTGRFSIGLYFELYDKLKNSLNYEVETTDLLLDQVVQTYKWSDNYTIEKLNLELRPYQESSIKKCIAMGYGVVLVGTAGGKTLIMATLVQTIRAKEQGLSTLIILPSNIAKQTYKEFVTLGIPESDLSLWSSGTIFTKAPIIIASIETLRANLNVFSERPPKPLTKWKPKDGETYEEYVEGVVTREKQRRVEWNTERKTILNQLSDINLVLIDEIHSLRKDNVINDTLDLFPTRHRFGFTGTLPAKQIDQWNITGTIGPVLININSAALREMNYVAQVMVNVIKINYLNPPDIQIDIKDPTKGYLQESEFIYQNTYRNQVIKKISSNLDKNILILVDKIEHGEALEQTLRVIEGKTVCFIQGAVDMEVREQIRAQMEQQDNIICIAMSRIFAVGINIKNLHYVIFAQGGKAKVTLIQSIGRGLRLHESKNMLVIFDIADNLYYGARHLEERLVYYKDEKIHYETKELFER